MIAKAAAKCIREHTACYSLFTQILGEEIGIYTLR